VPEASCSAIGSAMLPCPIATERNILLLGIKQEIARIENFDQG